MEKQTLSIVAIVLGALVLLGVIGLYVRMPETPEIPKCPDLICPEPSITTEEIEVIKEVEVTPDYKQKVVDALMEDLKGNSELRYCDDEKYKASEIKVKRLYYGYTLTENGDGDTAISDVKIKLNFDDGECYKTLNCGLDTEQELNCE